MSRIHEALKKAAEERAAKVATEVEPRAAEIKSEPRLPSMLRPELAVALPIATPAPAPKASPRVTTGAMATPGFSYEELLKRCVPVCIRLLRPAS